MSRPMKFDDIMELIDENPVAGAAAAQQFCDGVQARTYQGSAAAFKLAKVLQGSPAWRAAFYKDDFWTGGYLKNTNHLLLHCHQYLYRARDGRDGRRAEDHARASQPVFDDADTTAEVFLRMLMEDGGFDGLKKATSVKRLGAGADEGSDGNDHTAGSDDDGEGGSREDSSNSDHGHATDEEAAEPTAARAAAKTVATDKKREEKDGKRQRNILWPPKEIAKRLMVDMPSGELDMFLANNSDIGDEAVLHIVRQPDDTNGMLVWRAIKIQRSPLQKR